MGNENSNTRGDELISDPTRNPHKMSENRRIYINPAIKTIISQVSQECCIIWHDSIIVEDYFCGVFQFFLEVCTVYPFDTWKEAALHIKKSEIPCFVISSGEDGEAFTNEISKYPQLLSMYVYCENVEFHNKWTKQNQKIAVVTNKDEELQAVVIRDIIRWKRETYHSKIHSPTLSTTLDQKGILSRRVKEIITIDDKRDEAKRDFLNLVKALLKDYRCVEIFEAEYQPELVMRWFNERELIYKVVDNCLRLKNVCSIMYCRLIVSDLQSVIFKTYQDKIQKRLPNSNFSGKLYQEVYMEKMEWEAYKRNVGQDTALTNFFQAEIIKKHSLNSDCNVRITIIVPEEVDDEGQGFANISEDKIIFNIFSRFNIFQAFTEMEMGVEMHNLVLIYCTRNQKKATLKFSVRKESDIICQFCEESFEIEKNPNFYANLLGEYVEYTCQSCLKKDLQKEVSPLFRISAEIISDKEKLQAARKMIRDKLTFSIPFDVNCCSRWKSRKRFYKCTDCKGPESVWCQSCVEQKKECQKEGHFIVHEKNFSSFCNEGARRFLENAEIYEEAEELVKIGEDNKALELYHEVIKKNQIIEAETYQKLGRIYCTKNETQKGEQYLQKALLRMKSAHGEKNQIVGEVHKDLGEIKEAAGDLIIALYHYFKALRTTRENFGIESEEVLKLKNVISETYKGFMKKKRDMIKNLKEAQEAYEKYSESHGVNGPEINEHKERYVKRFRLLKEYQDAEEKFPDFLKEMLE